MKDSRNTANGSERQPHASGCTIDDVLITHELSARPTRSPNHADENRALCLLVEELATNPRGVLQKTVETIVKLCRAGSAGIGILEPGNGGRIVRWHAVAGQLATSRVAAMPFQADFCRGLACDQEVLLLRPAEALFPNAEDSNPPIHESLLARWPHQGEIVGTVWAIAHTPERRFDAEDARLLSSLARFASAAWQMEQRLEAADSALHDLERAGCESTAGLRVAEDRLQAALTARGMASWDWDPETDRLAASATMNDLVGLPPGEHLETGAQAFGLMHPADLERHRAEVEAARRSGGSWHSEFRIVRPIDKQIAWLEERAQTTCDPLTGKVGITGLVWDITERKRAEDALREGDARFRAILDIATVGIIFFDLAGRITDANDAFLSMVGFSRDELKAGLVRYDELTPPDWLWKNPEVLAELRATGQSTPFEKQYFRKDGSRIWILCAGKMLGETSAVEFVLDVTERKRAEAALHESQQRFRLIVETARDYAIFSTDPEHRIVDWLPSAASVFGWSAEEAVGRLAEIMFTPEDREAGEHEKELATAREQGLAPDVRWHLRKDGTRVFIEGSVTALRDQQGEVQGFLKIGQDVTERRAAEERLRESEARFRQFGEASSTILWIRNAETLAFEYLSPAFETIYGESRAHVLGGNNVKRWAELILPDDREQALNAIKRVRAGERVTHHIRVRRPCDGQSRWLQDIVFPLFEADGRVQRIAGIAQDITEAKETAGRLHVLIGELQHRTRNLIAVIQSLAIKTGRESRSIDDFQERFGHRLGALARVQGLLSRLTEGGKITFDELLRSQLEAHGALDAGARVTLDGPAGVRLRSTTIQTFALALHELATNAVKYGALSIADGRLDVRWRVVMNEAEETAELLAEWVESGVHIPRECASPEGGGYGRELIERALPYQLKARTKYEFGPDGVRCTIILPITKDPNDPSTPYA